MSLTACKVCGKVYDSEFNPRELCTSCLKRFEKLYSRVYKYLRDNEDMNFDIEELSDAMDIPARDIQILIELGYLERDIQTYGKDLSPRQKLALELGEEIDRMKARYELTTYGGIIYKRKNTIGGGHNT